MDKGVLGHLLNQPDNINILPLFLQMVIGAFQMAIGVLKNAVVVLSGHVILHHAVFMDI